MVRNPKNYFRQSTFYDSLQLLYVPKSTLEKSREYINKEYINAFGPLQGDHHKWGSNASL